MNRLDQLLQLIKESPDDSFLNFALAKEYEKGEKNQLALKHYLHILKVEPEYIGLYYHLGKLYEIQSEPQKAFETYTDGMHIAKKLNDQHALSELAGARLSLGDEEDFL